MQRYFLQEEAFQGKSVVITGEDARHISRVMRMRPDDEILCVSPGSRTALCKIEEIEAEHVSAQIIEWMDETTELPVSVTIAQGIPKADKLEMIVQKGTELGASAFIPFQAGRSIVKWDEKKAGKKVDRLKKIGKEAAEQSHRSKIPDIDGILSFKALLETAQSFTIKLAAYEEAAKAGEQQALTAALSNARPGDSILAVIGPEGGLTPEEALELEQNGFILCGLGPRILRTETAPLYLLSAVSYQLELMR
ncbi:16S rRNA (uracil(1498)-N(3))-methyltransferase [Bacillus marinisedimentorum]|uniref:16S rRNA (uracil(1498)-N(3))-methyltransferase n=1 Tax=Bacillus marinisedimentorum TaxID=1821260 RepID=UPI000871DD9F|nr:16S rRNA (uracil(1498)-N(3))-methyltransferase [Bacillus marinisedimentorum]